MACRVLVAFVMDKDVGVARASPLSFGRAFAYNTVSGHTFEHSIEGYHLDRMDKERITKCSAFQIKV